MSHHAKVIPGCPGSEVIICPPTGVQGVTDGSNALPGMVGEWIQTETDFPYQGYPTVNQLTVSLGVLQPGDWDCFVTLAFPNNDPIGTTGFYLNPTPPGFSTGMGGSAGAFSPAGVPFESIPTVLGQPARASLTVPTQIAFLVRIDQEAAPQLLGGIARMWFQARRMR